MCPVRCRCCFWCITHDKLTKVKYIRLLFAAIIQWIAGDLSKLYWHFTPRRSPVYSLLPLLLSFFFFLFFSRSSKRGPWEWNWVPLRLANREIIFRAAPNCRNISSNHKGNRLRHLNVYGNIRSLGAPCYTRSCKRKTQQKAAGYRGNQPECRIHKAF